MDRFDLILKGATLEERLEYFRQCFAEVDEEDRDTLSLLVNTTNDIEIFEECICKLKTIGAPIAGYSFSVEKRFQTLLYEALKSEEEFSDFASGCFDFDLSTRALEQVKNEKLLAEVVIVAIGGNEISKLALDRITKPEVLAWVAVATGQEEIKGIALGRLGVNYEQAFDMVNDVELLEKLVYTHFSDARIKALHKIRERKVLEKILSFYMDIEDTDIEDTLDTVSTQKLIEMIEKQIK